MIRWLRKIFGKSKNPHRATPRHLTDEKALGRSEDARAAALRQLVDLIPDEQISELAAEIASREQDKALSQGLSISESEMTKLQSEIEYRLRNPGEHKGRIPVRAESLYTDIVERNGRNHGSSSSSPISDIRVKSNVRPLCNALEAVLALRGVEFDWRQEEYPELDLYLYPRVGLLAQEVESVVPTVVGENERGLKTVNYACLVPVLIEAVKEQQVYIERLQHQLHSLEERVH